MKKRRLGGVCAACALAVLLLPEPAPAQVQGGLRDRVGSIDRGDARDRGRVRDGRSRARGRVWDGRSRDRVRYRSSIGIWLGPTEDPWWWGPSWYSGPSSYPDPYRSYDPYDPYDYYRSPASIPPSPETGAQQAPDSAPRAAVESTPQPDTDPPGPVPEEYRWYYCQDPPGYYPSVRDCPNGWSAVSPAPGPSR